MLYRACAREAEPVLIYFYRDDGLVSLQSLTEVRETKKSRLSFKEGIGK